MKPFTIKLIDDPEYVKFLKSLTETLELINEAKDLGLNKTRSSNDYLLQGKGEYAPLVFEALYSVGVKSEIECSRFLGSCLLLTWENLDD